MTIHICWENVKQYCSWTKNNPGRRFQKCTNNQGRCPQFLWIEPEIPEETKGFMNNMRKNGQFSDEDKLFIRHMLLNIWNLEQVKQQLESQIYELESQVNMYGEILGTKFDISDI